MRHPFHAYLSRRTPAGSAAVVVLLALALVAPRGQAQTPGPETPAAQRSAPAAAADVGAHATHGATATALSPADAAAFARLTVAVAQVRDSAQKQLAFARNTTPQAQQQLRSQTTAQIAALLRGANLSDAEYRRRTYVVSTDAAARRAYDVEVARLTGEPTPGQAAAVASASPAPATDAATPALPAGPLGTHLGHLLAAFPDAPMGRGLIPTALAEARTAAVHAGLAARDPANLAAMKLHANHVLNAVDPSAEPTGPGLGYGVKRAAVGVVTHAALAAAVPGAAPGVAQHGAHVQNAGRATVRRADAIAALVTRIRAASTAAEAAPLVGQLVALATELTEGRDANADGRVDTSEAEAGLHQADEHARLMAAAGR